jgi:outer membrane protein assembly factor BamE (lipoprotein component of BamABCDE complex)
MLTTTNKNYSIHVSPLRILVLLLAFLPLFVLSVNAQTNGKKNLPVWQNYKGVAIGMPAAEVREKLGAPKLDDADGFFYVFSDTETAQVMFDAKKNVSGVSVVFAAEHAASPTFADVFGKAEEATTKPDGSIYKLVRYPDAGYWVSYSRMAGETAMVTITIQKL